MPPSKLHSNLILAAIFLVFALVIAFVWVPLDTGSGLVEKVRRRISIGDALAPTVAAGFIGLGALLLLFERRSKTAPLLGTSNLFYLAGLLVLFAIGFAVMRWAGPLTVGIADMLTEVELTYRPLRDTAPWKYIGYFMGCGLIVTSLVSWVEGRLTRRALVIGALAAAVLIFVYNVPFDDLVLPPNGDV